MAADVVKQIAKAAKRADEVAEVARRTADTAAQNRFSTQVVSDIDAEAKQILAEYEQFSNQSDEANAAFLQELDDIAEGKVTPIVLEAEKARTEEALFDPTVDIPDAGAGAATQTRTPEEFSRRMLEQLRDPTYSVKNTLGFLSSDMLDDVIKSQLTHNDQVERMLGRLRDNKRWGSSYDGWVGDSPYKDNLMFHVEKQTDPTRAPGDFIQFEKPREMGVHAGTSKAANRIIHAGGVETAALDAAEFSRSMDELAELAGIPPQRLNRQITRELEDHFQRKFTGGQTLGDMTSDEWKGLLDDVESSMGLEASEELNRLFSFLKEAPTPNSTPMVFRGRNGLLLSDEGNFRPDTVLEQLRDIFPEDRLLIDSMSGGREELTKKLQTYIEDKGYDHIVYHNSVEDRGNLSIINWNPELQASPWELAQESGSPAAAAQAFLGMMGVGAGTAALDEGG